MNHSKVTPILLEDVGDVVTVELEFDEQGALFGELPAGTDTGGQHGHDMTHVLLGIVSTVELVLVNESIDDGGTSTHEEVGGAPATLGIVAMDGVADGPHQLTGKVVALTINGLVLQTTSQGGDVSTDTEVEGVVEFLHTEDVETNVGRPSPHTIRMAHAMLLSLPVIVDSTTECPVTAEAVTRVVVVLCKGANGSHQK